MLNSTGDSSSTAAGGEEHIDVDNPGDYVCFVQKTNEYVRKQLDTLAEK